MRLFFKEFEQQKKKDDELARDPMKILGGTIWCDVVLMTYKF